MQDESPARPDPESLAQPGRLEVGQKAPRVETTTLEGTLLVIPHSERLVHLQFRRFAGCPICNLHLQSIARRHEELADAGIVEVAVFHSNADDLRSYGSLPFSVIADPERSLYAKFGVETSARALLDPRSWSAAARGLFRSRPTLSLSGGPLGLPGDFLIEPSGRIAALKYGAHADDQWSVDEILAAARSSSASTREGSRNRAGATV